MGGGRVVRAGTGTGTVGIGRLGLGQGQLILEKLGLEQGQLILEQEQLGLEETGTGAMAGNGFGGSGTIDWDCL